MCIELKGLRFIVMSTYTEQDGITCMQQTKPFQDVTCKYPEPNKNQARTICLQMKTNDSLYNIAASEKYGKSVNFLKESTTEYITSLIFYIHYRV